MKMFRGLLKRAEEHRSGLIIFGIIAVFFVLVLLWFGKSGEGLIPPPPGHVPPPAAVPEPYLCEYVTNSFEPPSCIDKTGYCHSLPSGACKVGGNEYGEFL